MAAQSFPHLFAGVLVKRHRRAPFASDQTIKEIAIDQGMGGIPPDGRFGLIFLAEIFLPKRLAGLNVQATQVAHGAERVDATLMNQRSGSRPAGIRNLVRAIIFVLPYDPAIEDIET